MFFFQGISVFPIIFKLYHKPTTSNNTNGPKKLFLVLWMPLIKLSYILAIGRNRLVFARR